jgi:hypothetical protein
MFWAARELQWSHKRAPCSKELGNHLTGFVVGIMDWKSSYEPGISCKHESLACVEYVPWVCTHRPSLVPTSYLVRSLEANSMVTCHYGCIAKVDQTWWFGGTKSRNKVSVGEPAEGSLMYIYHICAYWSSCEKEERKIQNPWYLLATIHSFEYVVGF